MALQLLNLSNVIDSNRFPQFDFVGTRLDRVFKDSAWRSFQVIRILISVMAFRLNNRLETLHALQNLVAFQMLDPVMNGILYQNFNG